MEKLKMHTPDLTQDHIARIRELFPNCVTEARDESGKLKLAVDFDQLKQELSDSIVEGSQERYHLNWPGKREALLTANAPIAKTLRPARDESVNFDTTKNLFIEGDNLEALKLLQETYLGKIKMIYIDPPYNTGNDFIYEDDFSDDVESYLIKSNQKSDEGLPLVANPESNGRFHSDWLSFLYPRLKLCKNLLSEDGLIFISIDQGETHNLRSICNEIFGSENFISQIALITGANQSGDGVRIQSNAEYCLVYSKDKLKVVVNRVDEVEDSLRNLNDAPTPLETRTDMGYTIYFNPKSKDLIPLADYDKSRIHLNEVEQVYEDNKELLHKGYIPIRPGFRNKKLHRWRWGLDMFLARKSEVVAVPNKDGTYTLKFQQSGYNAPKNVMNFGGGAAELKEIFDGDKLFEFPKSTAYIRRLLMLGSNRDSTILDFFSGSATTAHAVLAQNSEDGGNRKFIMVQLPEECDPKSEAFKAGYKTIAEISKERIRRAGRKIAEQQYVNCISNTLVDRLGGGDKVPEHPTLDIGFRVLKIDTSNMADIYYVPDAVKQSDLLKSVDNIKPDRANAEDLLFQVLLDWGVDLTLPIAREKLAGKQVYFVDGNALAACFDTDISEDFVKELASRKPLRVVFRDNGFTSDAVKINVDQIFKQLSSATEVKSI